MREVLEALNQLVRDGLIRDYAIGGAIGASFYIQAAQTEDVDAFVFLPEPATGLVMLTPIFDALIAMGGIVEGQHIRFGNWPLQILTDANQLIAEAIRGATPTEFDGVPTQVFTPEHLCAIALQTGRAKDYLRTQRFLEAAAVDRQLLSHLITRFEIKLPQTSPLSNLEPEQ